MRWIWAVMFCGGANFWLSNYYQVPYWVLWSLFVLGVLTWSLAKWLEFREAEEESNNDQAH